MEKRGLDGLVPFRMTILHILQENYLGIMALMLLVWARIPWLSRSTSSMLHLPLLCIFLLSGIWYWIEYLCLWSWRINEDAKHIFEFYFYKSMIRISNSHNLKMMLPNIMMPFYSLQLCKRTNVSKGVLSQIAYLSQSWTGECHAYLILSSREGLLIFPKLKLSNNHYELHHFSALKYFMLVGPCLEPLVL